MKKKLSKILGVGLAGVLAISLVIVAAPPQGSEVAASPDVTFRLSPAAAAAGTACWDNTTKQVGTWSVELKNIGPAGSIYLEFVPEPGVTLADLKSIAAASEWSFWHNSQNIFGQYAQLELRFTSCYNDDPNGAGHVDVTLMALQNMTGSGTWLKQTFVATDKPAWVYYGNAADGTAFDNAPGSNAGVANLTGIEGLINAEAAMAAESASAWELTRVRIELWEAGARTCNIDDIKIDGTLYAVERGPEYWIDPDIAYNVKTATETFTLMGPCGPVDTTAIGDISWSVEKGCGEGMVYTVAGGGVDDNFVTVRMNTKGDAHICAMFVVGRDAQPDETIEVCAEKKWGEIYCTDLESDPLGDNVFCVTETVLASFLWDDCIIEREILVDAAVVDWWLMRIGALAAVQALEAALGDDPCDVDGGCGGYIPDFFSYDIDASGVIEADEVFDSPREAMLAIYAQFGTLTKATNYISPDVFPAPTDATHEQTTTDTDGESAVTVTLALPTAAILVTLTDYPIDKHGQNTVCVQHETFVPPPPPAQVKVPQVRWAGEKIVLEKEWGIDYIGNLVMFALEEGSIGDLVPLFTQGTDSIVSSDSRTVFTVVDPWGVARVMFKTEQQGQVDVECVLYLGTLDYTNSFDELIWQVDELTVLGNHGFLVYYLAFEEIHWPEMPVLDAGVALDPIPCVSGWFTSNALPKTLRPEAYQDVNNDGIPDFLLPAGRYVLPFDWPLLAGFDLESRPWYDLMDSADLDNVTSVTQLGPWINVNSIDGLADAPSIGPFNTLQQWSLLDLWFADATVVADRTVAVVTTVWDANDLRNTVVPNEVLDWYDCPMSQALGKFEIVGGTAAAFTALVAQDKGSFWPYGVDRVTGLFQSPFYEVEIPSHWLIPAMEGTPMGYMWDSWFDVTDGPYDYWQDLDLTTTTPLVIEVYGDNHSFFGCHIPAPWDGGWVEGTVIFQLTADYPYLPAKFPAITSTIEITWGAVVVELNPHFQADKLEVEVDEVVTFDNLTAGGTTPYTKAEWDFDADGVIDETIVGTHAVVMADVTHAYDAPGVYNVRLWMTDSTPTTRYEQRDDYIIVAGEVGMKGDFDSDGDIDLSDFAAFGDAYGSVSADANYDVIGDFDDDGDIDLSDFAAFGDVYGYGT